MSSARHHQPVTLVFDGNCGFCTRVTRVLTRLDRCGSLRFVAAQQPGVLEAHGLTPEQAGESFWLCVPGAAPAGFGAGLAALVDVLTGCRAASRLIRFRPLRAALDALYQLVARNRHRLPGATPWCVSHPGACEPAGHAGAPSSCGLSQ